MEINSSICTHAEVQNGLLYTTGGGLDRVFVVPGSVAPWSVNIALALNVLVGWTETVMDHKLSVRLVDFDTKPVYINSQSGSGERVPFMVEMGFNVNRGDHIQDGESQSINFALSMPGLPIPKIGTYVFILAMDNEEVKRLSFRVANAPVPV